MRVRSWTAVVIVVLIATVTAIAVTIPRWVISSGGCTVLSPRGSIQFGSVGLPVTGVITSASAHIHSGFWFPPLKIPTDVQDEDDQTLPRSFALHQNYPNPFNPATVIEYSLPRKVQVRLEVFNVLGQSVRLLRDQEEAAGINQVTWDGTDDAGRNVASGIYFCRIRADEFADSRKMLLLK